MSVTASDISDALYSTALAGYENKGSTFAAARGPSGKRTNQVKRDIIRFLEELPDYVSARDILDHLTGFEDELE